MNDNFPPGYHGFETDNDWDETDAIEETDEDDDSADVDEALDEQSEYEQKELLL